MNRAWGALLLAGLAGTALAQPANHFVYVTNEMSGDLSVIDAARREVVATVPLGKRPRGAALAPDGRTLYVALSGSPIAGPGVDASRLPPADKSADGIGAVDLVARKLAGVLRGVSDPEQLVLSRDGRRMFIASEDRGLALTVDVGSGTTLRETPVGGEPEGMALSPDGSLVYVTSENDHLVTVLDAGTGQRLAGIRVGRRPRAAAFAPDGSRAYVSGENDASLTVIDPRRHRVVKTLKLGADKLKPMGVAVAPDGRRVFVSTGRGGSVVVVDAQRLAVVGAVEIGGRPWGIALSPDGRWLYTANGPADTVSVIDTRSLQVAATIEVGTRPWGVTVGPAP